MSDKYGCLGRFCMGKTCTVCGISFFSPDDSDKCGKCREKMAQEGHEEHSGCGCGHSH